MPTLISIFGLACSFFLLVPFPDQLSKRYKEEKKALGNDKQTIKEQVKQVNTQVVVHNALPLDDKSTAKKIAGIVKFTHSSRS